MSCPQIGLLGLAFASLAAAQGAAPAGPPVNGSFGGSVSFGYRPIFYVARFAEAVYVLHSFVKKTRATRKADIDMGKTRYAAMLEARKGRT